jgi:restriction endonuclease S subunit
MSEGSSRLPDTWLIVRVGDAGEVRLGRQRSPDQMSGRNTTPYLRAGNIASRGLDLDEVYEMDFTPTERETFQLRPGDLVLAEASGSATHVGRPALWNGELDLCCFQNTVVRFRPHLLQPAYALVAIRHLVASGAMARAARGVGLLHLGAGRFSALQLPLPPWDEQARIAAEVARRERHLTEAEAALRAALSRAEEQAREVLAAVSNGTLLARTDILDRVGHGTEGSFGADGLPPGWEWAKVKDVGDVQLGKKREPTSHRGSAMRSYLRVANVQEDRIEFDDLHQMHFTAEERETFRLESGDILLNEGQSLELVGRPAMFRGELSELYFQMTLLRFRARPMVDPNFALLVFRSYLREGRFRTVSRGSTNIAHLSRKRFVEMPFPLPPLTEQHELVELARMQLEQIEVQRAASESALAKIPLVATELLAAAVGGQLVSGDPAAEPASALIARLGPVPDDNVHSVPSPKKDAMAEPSPAKALTPEELAQVLRTASGALSFSDLFRAAGYDPDDTQDVERFYLLLRDAVGTTVYVTGDHEDSAFEAA